MGEEHPSLTERNGSALWLAARDRLASSYHPAKANFVPFFFFFVHFFLYLFIWLSRVFVAARIIFVAPHGLSICSTQT